MMITPSEAPSFCVELPVNAGWASVAGLHRALMGCLEVTRSDPDLSQVIGMVASELVENAIKYGDWSRPQEASITVRRRAAGGGVIEIQVSSPAASRDALEAVKRWIAWIRGFPSARDAFTARVLSLSEATAGRAGGLGLVRVAYEAGCELDAWLSQDDKVLYVKATLPGAGLPAG